MYSPGERVQDIRLSVLDRTPQLHEGMFVVEHKEQVLVFWDGEGYEVVSIHDIAPVFDDT
jgi:hypothetical protein